MKKIAVKMLMLVMAMAVSQVSLADRKDKTDKEETKQGTEHRGFGNGRDHNGDRSQRGMQRPGQRKGFDLVKWDSIRAAHQKDTEKMKEHREAMRQKMDSIRAAHRENMQQKWDSIRTAHRESMQQKWDSLKAVHPEWAAKMDSLKAAHANNGHKADSIKHGHGPKHHAPMMGRGPKFHRAPMMGNGPKFRHHPPFGRPMFAHRPHGFRNHRGQQAEQPAEAQVKAAEMDATAITKVTKSQDAPAYDLQGRQIQGQQGKGLIIRNGKKYVK